MPSVAYYEILRNLVYRSIQKETRLSERQVSQLRWSQINDDTIVTKYKRQVKMSRELTDALSVMPRGKRSDFVFHGTSLFHYCETDEMALLRKSLAPEKSKKIKIFSKSICWRTLTKSISSDSIESNKTNAEQIKKLNTNCWR